MIASRIAAALVAAFSLALPAMAQGAAGCPDMEVQFVPGLTRIHGQLNCPGARISVSGFTIDSARGNCPAFAWLVPPRYEPVHRRGSHTFVVGEDSVSLQLATFRCRTDYWFGLVPVGAGCEVDRVVAAGRLPTYRVHPCALLDVGSE